MKVKINDIELYYQKFGTGHPIILLHDYFQDGSIFDKLIAPLSLSYTVYVPDLRGYGMSQGKAHIIIKLMQKIWLLLLEKLISKSHMY